VVPPLTAVAVNVTGKPLQMTPLGSALMLTLGVTKGFTVIFRELLVTCLLVAQETSEVKMQVITSPLLSVVLVNVDAPFPMFEPLSCHW
jgi:hypothetical protein